MVCPHPKNPKSTHFSLTKTLKQKIISGTHIFEDLPFFFFITYQHRRWLLLPIWKLTSKIGVARLKNANLVGYPTHHSLLIPSLQNRLSHVPQWQLKIALHCQTVEDRNRRREEDDVVVHRFGEMNSLSDDPIEASQSRDGDDDENAYDNHAEEPGRKLQELSHHVRTRFRRK